MSEVKITVDREKCCGAGQCVLAAPELFDQDEDGIVVLLTEVPEPAQVPGARDAAMLCPAAAITLDE